MAGQTINDRLLAAKHSLAGQGLAKSVCKATTEELIGPKKKHLDCKYTTSYIISDSRLYVVWNATVKSLKVVAREFACLRSKRAIQTSLSGLSIGSF